MSRYYVILFLLVTCVLNAQQGRNPFDISRHDTLDTSKNIELVDTVLSERVMEDTTVVVESSNPFEVQREHLPRAEKTTDNMAKKVKRTDAKVRKSNDRFLLFPILLCCILLAFVINIKTNILSQTFKALTNDNILKMNQRIENNGLTIPYILLYFVHLIGGSVFLFLVLKHLVDIPIVYTYLGCLLFVLAVYMLRHSLLIFTGSVFKLIKETFEYSFSIISYNILFGIVCIPLNLLIVYGPSSLVNILLYIGLAVFVLLLIIRILRGIFRVLPLVIRNKMQFFLYLCTFEILPYLIFVKLVFLR